MFEFNEKLVIVWEGFIKGDWQNEVNVCDFIQKNYILYEGDEFFLVGVIEVIIILWDKVMEGVKLENCIYVLVDFDIVVVFIIIFYDVGYINKQFEKIVGLQIEVLLKCVFILFGGIKMIEGFCKVYNCELDLMIKKIFIEYCKIYNQGVFDVYILDILCCCKFGVLIGLLDVYGCGCIIGDYCCVVLYGIDYLMKDKLVQFIFLQVDLENGVNLEQIICLCEEIVEQYCVLGQMKEMAVKYGYDIFGLVINVQEVIQWIYFGYLAVVKFQNGAVMFFGCIFIFLDVYIECDLKVGKIIE